MQKAYELYSDKLEIIAMNTQSVESDADVAEFKASNGYTFPMVKADPKWNQAMGVAFYPRTIIIDRYGVICLIEANSVEEEGIFEGAFSHFTSENYQQKLVSNIEELDTMDYPEGHKRNPMLTHGAVGSFEINVQAGKAFYCNIMRCDGIIFKVQNPNVYVMYGNKRYEADANGVISFELSCASTSDAAKLEIYNNANEDQNITVNLETPPGTISTPYDMTYGATDVFIKAGNDQGVFYTMTADQTGFILLSVTGLVGGEQYEIQIDNLNTMKSVRFSESCVADEEGNMTVAIPVTAGDQLRIAFMSDSSKNNPETTIQTLVSYSEHGGIGALEEISYSLTFKDVEGLPMAGITATFTVNGEAVVLISDEEGMITTLLPEGSYMVQLVFPEGFTADASQYLLTPEDTSKEIVVRLYQEKEITYIIHVQDNDGLPVPGVVVTVGTSYMRTDENGNAEFKLPVGTYYATVVAPAGYVSKQDRYSFGHRPDVTIVLENNQSASRIPYTITVLDGFGKPYSDVVVRLYAADGSTHMLIVTDGVATEMLFRGEYTVELVFQQSNMRYEQIGLQLTEEVTSTTIVVAPGISGKPVKVSPTTTPGATFDAYYVQMGNNYIDVEPMTVNYFLFKPTQTGTYKFYTNRTGAKVENWNTLVQTTPLTSGVEDNVMILEVTDLGDTYVIGINAEYDTTNAILTVFRVPDCVQDPFPVTPELPDESYAPHLPEYAEIRYLDFKGMLMLVLGEDGYYHLDTADGPIVLVDLMSNRYGVSIMEMIDSGEMAWYRYDEDGYPIYRRDYTQAIVAYMSIMEPTKGLYPLTDDLYTILKEYGDNVGWWNPESENYLFGEDDLLIVDAAWMFLTCYIYIDPALCDHAFSQWEVNAEGTAVTRACPYCKLEEIHVMGDDCNLDTVGNWTMDLVRLCYTAECNICGHELIHKISVDCDDRTCGQWTLSSDGVSYERLCQICHGLHQHAVGVDCNEDTLGQWQLDENGECYDRSCSVCSAVQHHIIGADCTEETCGDWTVNEDGTGATRQCLICGDVKTHTAGADCDDHYGDWVPAEDGLSMTRTCLICGNVQIHEAGTDCDDHYGDWTPAEDGLSATRTCLICGNVQIHEAGTDCDDHYGEWTPAEDGLSATRTCLICGNVQIHEAGTDCDDYYGDWMPAEDHSSATRSCEICGNTQIHNADTDCEGHYSQWTISEDGTVATRSCGICGNTQTHYTGTDCQDHYGNWGPSEESYTAIRSCSICGHVQRHTVDVDCDAHYSQWQLNGTGLTATRSCEICGNTQSHTVGRDCETHYGQWETCEDGIHQQRECEICGNVQTQVIPQEPTPEPEPEPEPDPTPEEDQRSR